jgi:RNA polymerase sigma-70 factor (ECF subfamily)
LVDGLPAGDEVSIASMASFRRRRSQPSVVISQDAVRIEKVLKREAAALLAYFERRVRPSEDAADLLSETMLVAWRRPEVVPVEEEQARMWLYGVARNVVATHRRGGARRNALSDQLRSELQVRPESVGLDGRAEQDPRIDLVRDLIERLPDTDREIFTLVHWEGFTLAEVAQILDVPAGTVRSRYSRARASLRAQLEQD